MKTCKNCQFWKENSEDWEEKQYGSCSSDGFAYEYPEKGRTDQLVYSDSEGYSADFETGKDFGCIYFEVKK